MSESRTVLSRHQRRGGPRAWAAVHFRGDKLEYALARETDGQVQVVHEATASDVAGLRDQINPREHQIVTGMPCEEVLCRALYLPTTNEEELHQMLALQIDQLTPVPLDEVVYDFEPIEESDGQTLVLVAIARKAAVNDRVAPLEEAGLAPERVSIDAMSLYRTFWQGGVIERDDRLNTLIMLEKTVTHLVVYSRGWPLLVRSVFGAADAPGFPSLLARELSCTRLSAQAEWPEREMGSVAVVAVDPDLQETARAVADQCGDAAEVIADGTVPSPARCLCPLTRDERRFNLLPDEWRQRRRAARIKRLAVRWLAAVAVVYLLGFLGFAVVRQVRQAEVNGLQEEIDGLQPEYQAARQLHSELVAMQKQLDTKYSSLDVLREVSILMSSSIKLETFSFRRDETVVLKGQASSAQSVYDLISRLEQCALFSQVKTAGVKTQGSLTKFELVATLRSAADRAEGGGLSS